MQTILIWTIWRISKKYPKHGNQSQQHNTIISKKRNIWISMWFLRKRRIQVSSTFFASEICELEPQSHLPEFCWKVKEGMGGMAANLSPSSSFLEWSACWAPPPRSAAKNGGCYYSKYVCICMFLNYHFNQFSKSLLRLLLSLFPLNHLLCLS
jgi:hypothetical protein